MTDVIPSHFKLGLRKSSCVLVGCSLLNVFVDRDSAAWKLEEKIVQRRRNLFWEMYIFEMMHVSANVPLLYSILQNRANVICQSIALGRPMSVALNHIDCEPPNDDEASSDDGHNFAGCM